MKHPTVLRLAFALVMAPAIVCGPSRTSAAEGTPSPKPTPLIDKTLVVWASPGTLTQRGGSILTLNDPQDRFDGIVFGEIAPGKWMAGSELYRRTLRDQAEVPVETADAETFVQIAIAYRGNEVAVFRNGLPYSRYTTNSPPQEFTPQSVAIAGKRHRGQGDRAHFAGRIDDARVYDRALSAEEIAALKPNVPSVLEPWAWWTFDDGETEGGETKERTGRFAITQLVGGAEVRGGHLVLDGKTGTMLAKTNAPFDFETPTFPANPPANWLRYHLAHPGPGTAMPGDPNCAFYWKGRYHLHYIYTHQDGFAFAHVSSSDLVRWKWHPTTLTPSKTGHGMFSGTGFFTLEGRPAIIYHGQGSGRNQIAIAEDDQLEKWTQPWALEPTIRPDQDATKIAHWDPDAWPEGKVYYALSGGSPGSGTPPTLFRSPNLKDWDYLGLFLAKDMPDVLADEDVSCPNFFTIGGKHMLLCISHTKGCRYYLGEWKDERFTPDFHARMNWKGWDFFAPESLLTPDGRRVMWAWCNLGSPQSGIQSLPRELSLPEDGVLRIRPLRELESLRFDEIREPGFVVKSGTSRGLERIAGDTLELQLSLVPGSASRFGVQVYCDGEGKGGFPIAIEPAAKALALGDTRVPFERKAGESTELRIFLDKNMVEVFANDRQAAVASHEHPAESLGIRLFSEGGDLRVNEVKAWWMKSIHESR